MKIYKTYKDKIDWFEVDQQDLIEYTENRGYYKKGTALETLKEIGEIQTHFSIYKTK
jgi:hypothetical protein